MEISYWLGSPHRDPVPLWLKGEKRLLFFLVASGFWIHVLTIMPCTFFHYIAITGPKLMLRLPSTNSFVLHFSAMQKYEMHLLWRKRFSKLWLLLQANVPLDKNGNSIYSSLLYRLWSVQVDPGFPACMACALGAAHVCRRRGMWPVVTCRDCFLSQQRGLQKHSDHWPCDTLSSVANRQ